MTVTDEIKDKLDIVTYIQQYVPDLKKAGRYYKACCPFHGEKTPSFVVNPDTQSWRCFGACAEGGDVFSFAMKLNNWSFREALEELGKQAGVEVHKQSPQQQERSTQEDRLRGLLGTAADAYHNGLFMDMPEARAALQYVREKRGLNDETIARFGIGYALPDWQGMLNHLRQIGYSEDDIIDTGLAVRSEKGRVYDRFRNRLMIPIRDDRGRVVGFGGRALAADDNPKYMNSPQTVVFDKSHLLFGLDLAKQAIRDTETAVIVEGYMDVIQAHQAGFPNVVAQMGTAMTENQLKLLVPRYARRVVMALDADAAGQTATMRSLEVARQTLRADYTGKLSVDLRVLQIPGAKDPDDLLRETPDVWQELVQQAMPVADYVIEMEMANLPHNASALEREDVARRVMPLLLASENNIYRNDNIQKLSLRLKIAERDLLALAEEQRRIERAKPPRKSAQPDMPDVEGTPEPPSWSELDVAPPPDLWSEDFEEPENASPIPAAPRRRSANSKMEAHCLRLLFKNGAWLYQVNRKLRELADSDPNLMNGPLGEFGHADFSDTTYRAIMRCFMDSMAQDDYDSLDYMQDALDPSLVPELDSLLVDELEPSYQRERSAGDKSLIWTYFERRRAAHINWDSEILSCVLSLRLERLQQESRDFEFLLHDTDAESMPSLTYMQHLIQARHRINAELERIRNPSIQSGRLIRPS